MKYQSSMMPIITACQEQFGFRSPNELIAPL